MTGKRVYRLGFFVLLFSCIFLPCTSSAGGRDVSLQLWGQVAPFTHGEAGSGRGAPGYKDAFGAGFGGSLEVSWRPADRFSLLGGVGYETHDGKTYQDIAFDNLTVIPLYLGGRLHFLPRDSRWNPYLRMDAGTARLSSVDISFMGLGGRYWDASWVFLFDAGAGLEYRFDHWGVGVEVLPRYLGGPSSAIGPFSEANGSWTIPIKLGVAYHF